MTVHHIVRQAEPHDLEILDRIHTENMQRYVEQLYSWNPTLFRDNFDSQEYQVIECQNKIIGFIKIVISEAEIYLGEIQIVRDYQNCGIGTTIIKGIIKDAQQNHQRLWLRVLKSNPAQTLYQRLGFTSYAISSTHLILEIKN